MDAPSKSVTLVVGYHRETPPAPAAATSQGLDDRIALVLSSYHPGLEDACFDAPLWCAAANSVGRALKADRTEVLRPGKLPWWRKLFGGSEETDAVSLFAAEGWPDAPPDQVRWYRGKALVAVGTSELWVHVGGPEPYHDSYTFSWFVRGSHAKCVLEAITSRMLVERAQVAEVIHASPRQRAA